MTDKHKLAPDDFPAFFEAVHGYTPFDWQKRLATDVLERGKLIEVIHVPTGCGKTSLLDLALFELALEATRQSDPQKRTVPRRICFVIDRRLVVDEATEHARLLQSAILEAVQGKRQNEIVVLVAKALGKLSCDATEPLRVVRLRGGVYRDDGWAADPLTPTILVSTVDQIGSRLLFRGYGVSQRTRPIHAGLLAFDTRIILDEVHLSTTFAETLSTIGQCQNWAEVQTVPQSRRVSLLKMSATAGESENSFELSQEDRNDSRLRPRLEAKKLAELVEVKVTAITKTIREKQPKLAQKQEQENRQKMVDAIVEHAWSLANVDSETDCDGPPPRVVGIVVNRVATARQIFESLRSHDNGQTLHDTTLLTGRIRPYDRDRLLDVWLPKMKAKRDAQPDKTLFVVATQTVEVGANLDFDVLITEAAALDALRQRFGRLFRIPNKPDYRPQSASAVILIRSDHHGSNVSDDAVYGQSTANTWKWLHKKEIATIEGRGKSKRVYVDFGINDLDPKIPKEDAELRPLLAPQSDAPLLLPAHLEAWVQTCPPPTPDPDVAPFLHGQADATSDVQIVWRADLDGKLQDSWSEIISLMPPRSREALPVPLYAVVAWLNRIDAYQQVADVADVEGGSEPESNGRPQHRKRILRWRGRKDQTIVDSERLKPGDTIVVPTSYGGADVFGWNPMSTQTVADVADACLASLVASYPEDAFRRPELRVRLHPALVPVDYPDFSQHLLQLIRSAITAAKAAAHNDASDSLPVVVQALNVLDDCIREPAHHAAIRAMLGSQASIKYDLYPDHSGLVLRASIPLDIPDSGLVEQESEEPEDDDSSTLRSHRQITLTRHTESVKEVAKRFAEYCGLSDRLVDVLDRTGFWHDQGKLDRRFQSWLHGGELKAIQALAADQPLAKSGRDPKSWQSSEAFGYPSGSRHEYVSARLFEESEDFSHVEADLIKYLIGAHHGYGRPWPPIVNDPNPIEIQTTHSGKILKASSDHGFHRIDGGWVDLFWRMIHRYGIWGLAYLEALFVTADRHMSAVEQRNSNQESQHSNDEEPAA